jgi:hypothetical protein
LSTTKLRKSQPQDKGKLEEIVEWEPVCRIQCTLKYTQKGKAHPICQPLCVVYLCNGEESLKRVESGDDKTSEVDEKLTSQVEENEDKV